MATPGKNDGQGKKDRRDAAREKARVDREAERKRQRRNRYLWQGGIGLAVIAIAAIVLLVVVNAPKAPALNQSQSGPLNMISDGILLSGPDAAAVTTAALKPSAEPVATDQSKLSDTVNIVTYIDYQCPACQAFETTNSDQILSWVKGGLATLEVHPISFLDNSSQGNRYSTRAANAAACVANYDPDNFYTVTQAFYANQPAEATNGRTDKQILSVLSDAGSQSSKITSCVTGEKFVPWVTASTLRVQNAPFPNTVTPSNFSGTPTVFVNGQQYTGGLTDAAAFATFVEGIGTATGK